MCIYAFSRRTLLAAESRVTIWKQRILFAVKIPQGETAAAQDILKPEDIGAEVAEETPASEGSPSDISV